jgi:hypothetical protein
MKLANILALLGFLVMFATLTYGFVVGDFAAEGSLLLSLAWGKVTLIDVYMGFLLFSGWIIYREKSVIRSIIWVALMMVFGNLTACLYTLLALRESRGRWQRFWLGQRAEGA